MKKSSQNKMPLSRLICGIILLCWSCVGFSQQTITISWPSKQLLSQPITVNGNTSVNVVLQNVNDVLYTYQVTLVSTPVPLPVLAAAPAAAPAVDPCAAPKAQLAKIVPAFDTWQLNPWLDSNNKTLKAPESVALSTTLAYYNQAITLPLAGVKQSLSKFGGACADATVQTNYDAVAATDMMWEGKLNLSHTVTVSAVLEPLNNYTIHIGEYSIGNSTQPPTLTSACTDSSSKATDCLIQYQPQTDLLSVSGGYLFSELPSRTYSRGTVPNSSDAVLVVNGNSMSSLLAALVNVKVPCVWKTCSAKENGYSLALSIGPVYALNGSDVSKVGLFGGLSLGLWKYLYLSAGAHVGQFADFPPGFTHAGQDIPPSFTGPLTPVSRTSARFAFGVTFKGFSIPTGSKQSAGQVTTPSGTK